MRATLFLGLVACAGCNQILGIGDIPLAPGDAADDDSGTNVCYGETSLLKVCPKKMNGSITLGDVNTDTEPMCEVISQPIGGLDMCVITAMDITIPNDATVTGSRPLVLVSLTTITISGTFDASSKISGQHGAGANPSTCVAGAGNNDATNGGGGGAGGTFGGNGGNGGNGGGGTAGGQFTPMATLTALRGGCAGARGGNAPSTDIGGDSGGAVYLIASTGITFGAGGHIYAGGAGGRGGLSHNGGYGGGSGGLIGLEARMIMFAGGTSVAANGGSGGEGGSSQSGTDGHDGRDASHDNTPAAGGSGGTMAGGDGGNGAAGNMLDGSKDANANGNGSGAGGGGGGGSAGIVWVHGTLTGGAISPPPQMH